MASFRILNQAPQYLLEDGRVNDGGSLTFYETDLTTLKTTWSDEAMSVANSNPVTFDAAGRTTEDVWGLGEYGVVMKDADGNVIWTRNNVQASGDPGTNIPALVTDAFLGNDGSVLVWRTILQVPDPTGEAGKQLGTDGTLVFWEAKPTIPDLPTDGVESDADSYRIGDRLEQFGSGTIPANGSEQSSQSIVFGEAFASAVGVRVFVQIGPGASMMLSTAVTTVSATGFGVTAGGNIPGITIDTPQPFTWRAYGPAVIAP